MDGSQIKRIPLAENTQRLFFVHIPKTAGRTLINILERHFSDEEIFPYSYWNDVPSDLSLKRLGGHRLFRGHFFHSTIVSLLPSRPATLTMLRHPIDRILSAYNHTLRDPDHPHHHAIGGGTGTLMDYINMPDQTPTRNAQVTFLSFPPPPGKSVIAAQQCYSQDPVKLQDVELAKQVLSEMPFVGIQGSTERSFQLLTYTFQWHPLADVESTNIGVYRSRAEEREPEAIALLQELNQLDFELYDYGKQLFEERYQAMVNDLLWSDFQRQWERREKPDSIRIDLGEPFMGEGWYARERDSKGTSFCWMGFTKEASIHFAVTRSPRMRVEVGVKHAVIPELLSNIRVLVNGKGIATQKRVDQQSGLILLMGEFPGEVIDAERPITTVRLEVERSVPPLHEIPDNKDPRQLGIAVSWIEVKPVDGTHEVRG